MVSIGTPLSPHATRVVLLGGGELGKEVVIEFQRLGCEVVVVDRYPNSPAMQVAHRSHVCDMLDVRELRSVIESENPNYIVPEIEAIATDVLVEMSDEGFIIVPSATGVSLTMNRRGIRDLAARELQIPTSDYRFADNKVDFDQAVDEIGLPCIVKPVMSSSGKGQTMVSRREDADSAWEIAHTDTRGSAEAVIVEGFIDFDYEITLLTIKQSDRTTFCDPIGHRQSEGDYQESWQPQPMSPTALTRCQSYAKQISDRLGGRGLFGAEFFIKGDDVWFSEISPRPHDTGLVTLISQDLSEFHLHVRAILGLPIPRIRQLGPSASAVVLGRGNSNDIRYANLDRVLAETDTELRLFGKPRVSGKRRLGVVLARDSSIEDARRKASRAVAEIRLSDATDNPDHTVTEVQH